MRSSAMQDLVVPTPGLWAVDADASTVAFSVRHIGAATVRGRFERFEGWLDIGRDGTAAAGGWVDVASIDTGIALRDRALRSWGCFDAARHPRAAFEARAAAGRDEFAVDGELTIMGRRRPLELRGDARTARSRQLSLIVTGQISRRDFRLDWSNLLNGGVAIVSDRVSIRLDLTLRLRP